MWKQHELVMLPAKEKAILGLNINTKSLHLSKEFNYEIFNKSGNVQPQHLYILSSEEIKEGDWYVNININKVLQCDSQNFGVINLFKHCKKIIATTDELLIKNMQDFNGAREINFDILVPKIPQSFIEHFVSEYNKGNIITKVKVKYGVTKNEKREFVEFLWVKKDNTINIKPIKDSWSREEVKQFIFRAYNLRTEDKNVRSTESLNNWIEKNL